MSGKKAKMAKVMGEFKRGTLKSGSQKGPKVRTRAQAVAIGLSESGQSNKGKRARERRLGKAEL